MADNKQWKVEDLRRITNRLDAAIRNFSVEVASIQTELNQYAGLMPEPDEPEPTPDQKYNSLRDG